MTTIIDAAGSNMSEHTAPSGAIALRINDTLPAEILCSIFLAVYRSNIVSFPPSDTQSLSQLHHELLDLMLVCRAWQQLINQSPHLWTRVWVGRGIKSLWTFGNTGPSSDPQEWLGEVEDRFRKSGELPLEVTIWPDHIYNVENATNALGSTAHRWERLDISYGHQEHHLPGSRPIPTPADDIKQLLKPHMPFLESLHVGTIIPVGESGSPDAILTHVNLPSLSRLSCRGYLLLPTSAPCLASITLHGIKSDNLQRLRSHPLSLPNLVQLRVIRCPNILEILAILSAPALQTLVIGPHDGHVDDDWAEDPPFIYPTLSSYQHLQELQWGDWDSALDVLTYLLRRCPNLLRFSNYIHGSEGLTNQDHYVSHMPTHLISRDASPVADSLCPNLEEVCFDVVNPRQVEELVEAKPSIKRVRFLSDPSAIYIGVRDAVSFSEWEEPLERLREKVDVAIGMESWH